MFKKFTKQKKRQKNPVVEVAHSLILQIGVLYCLKRLKSAFQLVLKRAELPHPIQKRPHSTSFFNEKDKFIQAIVGEVKADALREFLNTDKGQNMFDIIYENKVKRNMSSILNGAGAKAKEALQGLMIKKTKQSISKL